MVTRRTRTLFAAGVPLLLVAVLIAAWAVDTGADSGRVARNVDLGGSNVGRMPEDRLAATVRGIAGRYATTKVKVETLGHNYLVPASQLGLRLDEEATIAAAMRAGRTDTVALRPLTWAASFVRHRRTSLRFRVVPDALRSGIEAMRGPGQNDPREPTIVPTANGFSIVSGSTGVSIDTEQVRRDLLARASSEELPLVVQARASERQPKVTDAQARTFAAEMSMKTARPLTVHLGGKDSAIDPATVRSWVKGVPGPEGLSLGLEDARVTMALTAVVGAATAVRNASFEVNGPTVTIVPSQTGMRCCAPDAVAHVREAIGRGATTVEVGLQVDQPTFTTEMATALGIKEPVGTLAVWKDIPQIKSFTTYYQAGQPRVRNIHLIADAVRGAIIKPGETFSINDRVGKRTPDKGYVEAPVIESGKHATDFGGGVSQFSTTLFNAAFFAGLDLVSYQSHTIHFDRYPYGREATLGFPAPDQKLKNSTPYGVLIWPTYNDTSLTVTLYSTQNVYGQQTGQTSAKAGPCTKVTTTRTRTYADGNTAEDTIGSIYRPAEGVNCP